MSGRPGGGARALAGGGQRHGPGRLTPPSDDFARVPPERRSRTTRRVAAFFGPYRLQVGVVLSAIIATSLIGLINPYLLKLLIDDVIVGHRYDRLNFYVGLMIVLPIVSGLIGVGQSYLNNVIGQRVMQDLRNALYAHLQRLSLAYHLRRSTGDVLTRITNDVQVLEEFVVVLAGAGVDQLGDAAGEILADSRVASRSAALSEAARVPRCAIVSAPLR